MNTNTCHISPLLLLCRSGFEAILAEEVRGRMKGDGDEGDVRIAERGLVRVAGAGGVSERLAAPFVFERQRLVEALLFPSQALKDLVRDVTRRLLPAITVSEKPWTLHVFPADTESDTGQAEAAARMGKAFLDFCADRFTRVFRRYCPPPRLKEGLVLQLCRGQQGTWGAVTPFEALSDRFPGGLHRVRMDNGAPSRSYLKIEEVFERMGEEPQAGQRVVDLGAAPGGWSWAFLRRGCHVTAVDRGPMKLSRPGVAGGVLAHRREDGIGFKPEGMALPLDWLVADMLIPPGVAMGMLKKWLEHRWARRLVVNFKLPQEQPWPVLEPVIAWLKGFSSLKWTLRQLYHDRREVTLYAEFGK
ncbi:MAG: hypothetical protein HY343_06625 [Lentisphaerae bacterium]|nr:hypothetical protein [Lentisphaerota bacterium]